MSLSCLSLSRAQSCDGGGFCLWDRPPVRSDHGGNAAERHWVCPKPHKHPPGRALLLVSQIPRSNLGRYWDIMPRVDSRIWFVLPRPAAACVPGLGAAMPRVTVH